MREVTPELTLDSLRKEAKRWLKAIRRRTRRRARDSCAPYPTHRRRQGCAMFSTRSRANSDSPAGPTLKQKC